MKQTITLLCTILPLFLFGQSSKNVSLVSFTPVQENMNDVWGYVAPDNTEYAIAGSTEGTYVFDLTDPASPQEVAFIPGPTTTWRDMKVWGEYAYVTNESSGGMLIMDLRQLPDTVITKRWTGSVGVSFESAHNIFIDEKGYAFIVGADYGRGGAIIADLNQDPWNPTVASVYDEAYIHDIFVRGDTMWSGEIYNGWVGIVDVSDKSTSTIPANKIMATQSTPNTFTHNVWVSDDNRTMVTTDEVTNGKVAAYDVSDLNNIEAKDQYRSNPGSNVIPHNAFYDGEFVVISYYRDGLRIVDASRPDNMVEVGHYDTSPNLTGGGFNGAWGVYPYLPSGHYLVTDIERGFFVLKPTLVNASYLEGTVTDTFGTPLDEVEIEISGLDSKETTTDVFGDYTSGVADPGNYKVTFRKAGYEAKIENNVTLSSGNTTFLDVELVKLPSYTMSGSVIDADTKNPIPFAKIKATDGYSTFTAQADAIGSFTINNIYQDTFTFYAGKWGYKVNSGKEVYIASGNVAPTIELSAGYYDDFYLDLEWSTSATATSGLWERADPIGTDFQGFQMNPEDDVDSDLGDLCYVTGNGGGGAGSDDVDNGVVYLTSPEINVSYMDNPVIQYQKWYMNAGGAGSPNDSLVAMIFNDSDSVVIDVNGPSNSTMAWVGVSLPLDSFWNKADTFRIQFYASDRPSSGHLVEAGIDQFEVIDGSGVAPTAGFYLEDVHGCTPFTFTPVDTSGGEPSQWKWIVSGPVVESFTGQAPQITINTPGLYDLTLVTTNAFGTDTLEVLSAFEVNESPMVTATATNASPGQNNGTASATVTGGSPPYTLEWTDTAGQIISNPINLSPGIYKVVATDAAGCMDSTTVEVGESATGLNAVDQLELLVYPNPFEQFIKLEYRGTVQIESITVSNIMGQEVNSSFNGEDQIIEMQGDLAAGIFILEIRLENGKTITRKLTKN